MNRRNFLRNLATLAAAVTASPLLVKSLAKAPAPALFTHTAKIKLPAGPRFDTIWLTYNGELVHDFSDFVEEIRIKVKGKVVGRFTDDQFRNLKILSAPGEGVLFCHD